MSYLFLFFFFSTPFLWAQSYMQKNCAADTARASMLFALGKNLEKTSKLDSAALCYEQAAEIWESACPEVKEEKRKPFWERYLESKNSRAWVFYLQEQADSSTVLYLQSPLQKAFPWLGENHPILAISYKNIGVLYFLQGRYIEALQRLQKALNINLLAWGENHLNLASNYNSMGVVYKNLGRYEEALQYYQKSLALQLAVLGENHPDVASSCSNIGLVYYDQGQYTEALRYCQKALAIRLALFDENHADVAGSYNNIGSVYQAQKRYAEALEHYQKALAIRLALFGENHPSLAMIYNNMGVMYQAQGRYPEALEHYQKALVSYSAALGENHPSLAMSYNNMGNVYQAQGRYPEALESYQKALESNTLNWKPQKHFDLPPSNFAVLNPEYLLSTLASQSQTLFRAYFSPEHSAAYRSCLPYALKATCYGASQLSRWRQMMRRETDQIELGKQATTLLSAGIACAFLIDSLGFKEQNPLKEAFFFSESNKAAALNLAMQENEALAAAGIPESLNALQQDYKRELTLCNQQLETVVKPETKADTLKKQYYENQRFTYAAKLDSLIRVLEKEYPKYYALKYATFVAGIDTLQKTLLAQSPNTAIIEYLVSDTALFIFAINTKNFAAKKILFSQEEFKKTLNQLGRSYYALTETDRQDPAKKQNYINAAAKLYQKLLAPVEDILQNKDLVIIPDGLLWELPFEILIKAPEKGAQKLEKLPFERLPLLNQFHSVRYSPSATAFLRSFSLPPSQGKGIFAIAPVFDPKEENILNSGSAFNRDVTYPQAVASLPGSESEVLELKRLFEKQNLPVKLLLNAEAKEEAFTGAPLENYRYIHLATHGVFNRNKPSWSYVLFSRPGDSAATLEKDGLLTAAECYNLRLDAELVTLSACETARGKLKPGEGLLGLTRGLLYSGARSVLVSQWKVPDQATSKLMQAFYQNLLSGMSKPKALQAAKEALRKNGFAHPYYWAAFVLVTG
jgi:CHAT domain-containing protein/tetratricopeptide (TPR) repeat protein